MSPPRRRSKRIASASTLKTSRAADAPPLSSLTESEEIFTEQPPRTIDSIMSSPMPKPSTPITEIPVKLPLSEMHPSKVHHTMAAIPSSGLKHGFVDINPDQKSKDQPSGAGQSTPSKAPTSPFTFRIARQAADIGLGPEARRMMDELREEAAKIKVDLVAQREQELLENPDAHYLQGRAIATAKGKANRYSAVHMAEFKKMDSIEGHPSAFRATPGRFTPVKTGIKRTQSKANLHDPEPETGRSTPVKKGLKRTQSKANLNDPEPELSLSQMKRPTVRAVPKATEAQREPPESSVKRVRQRLEDDATTQRPSSRDGSSIPRPKSSGNDSVRSGFSRSQTLSNVMTPTKASASRIFGGSQTPTITLVKSSSKSDLKTLAKSPSKPELKILAKSPSKPELSSIKTPTKSEFGFLSRTPSKTGPRILKKSATMSNLRAQSEIPSQIQTPGRFDRVKSILKRQFSASKPKSHLPQFANTTPKSVGFVDAEPTAPATTPGRKEQRHVEFTPDTKRAAEAQNSPTPIKSGLSRPRSMIRLQAPPVPTFNGGGSLRKKTPGEVLYPDLSAYQKELKDTDDDGKAPAALPKPLPQSVPGTFTFRSDHTIQFGGSSSKGFGASAGQASLRHVRQSMFPTSKMPGSFPEGNPSSPNKENDDPQIGGIPHGIVNKKRHRASRDDEEQEDEGARRGAKKAKKDPPAAEGDALLAPKLAGTQTPGKKLIRTPRSVGSASPQKKSGGLSISRLNMLARPKNRV